MDFTIHDKGTFPCRWKPILYCPLRLKVIVAMKLTFLLLTVACLQVSAGAYSQKISLSFKEATIEKVLQEIRKQSGYSFFYDAVHLRHAKPITISIKNSSVDEALKLCFEGQPFTYEMIAKTIIIKMVTVNAGPEVPELIDEKINGKVMDEKGNPMSGVTVAAKGGTALVVTNEAGDYAITVPNGSKVLQFSYVGYETQDVEIKGRTTVNVKMSLKPDDMNQVVVVGFGTQKKLNLTGSVAQVDGKDLENRPVANIGQVLQGMVANLNINTGGDPGGPGTNASFNIRGQATIDGGGSPLFIVDGMPVDQLNDINPNDIASISVLKDAAASAIYGARAPYGVILVTTKKGKNNQKPTVSYNNMLGWNSYTSLPRMANSLEFAEAFNIASLNSGQGAPFSQETIEKIKANMARPGSYPVSVPDPNNPSRWTYADPTNTDNVDWFRTYFKPWSFSQKHDLSLSGGSQNTTYYMGLGLLDQGGQLRYGNESFKRFNVTGNLHTEPTTWLRLDLKTRFVRRDLDIPFEYANQLGNWIHMATTRHPNWALRDPNGLFSIAGNVDFMAHGGRRRKAEDDLTLIGSAEIEPVKDWIIHFDYSYNTQASKNNYHNAYVWSYGPQGNKFNIGPVLNSAGSEMITDNFQSLNLFSTYKKDFSKHHIAVTTGYQHELYEGQAVRGEKPDLITDLIPSLGTGTGVPSLESNIPNWATMGVFGRVNYDFDEKYLFEVNGRYDGSSRFPEYNRFGFFPSVSVGYNLAKEKYWDGLRDKISFFKLYSSYGSLGNQNTPRGNFPYLATIPISSNTAYILNGVRINTLGAPGLISPDITWETSRTLNLGVEAYLLKNRLEFKFEWFVRNTLDMFGPASVLPATLGAAVPFQNNADLQTKGFDLHITWRDRISSDLSYNVKLVVGDYKSTVKKYYNPQKLLPLNTRNNSVYYEGMNFGEIWGMVTKGIIQSDADISSMADQSDFWGAWTQGDVMYADLNGDKKINWGNTTLNDHGDLTVIGNSTPRFSFGLTLGAAWKHLDFSMFWQGVLKRDIWLGGDGWGNDGNLFWGFVPNFGNNVYKATMDFWTPENRGAYYPKPYLSSEVVKNHRPQSGYIQNAAYARLKNLQIGYDISYLLQKFGFKRFRLFVSGENLATITKLHKNYDPELLGGGWGTGKVYPLLKTMSAGANITF
jgi:TonB-linked SusC/RagA family outer membrane protein